MPEPWENDPPASQSDVRKSDNYIAERLSFEKVLKPMKLNTKDKDLLRRFFMSNDEMMADINFDLTPENLENLAKEIANTKDPKVKAMLLEEQRRLTPSFSNTVGSK